MSRLNRCRDFINQLANRNRVRLYPFNSEEWLRGAYSTFQRNLRYGNNNHGNVRNDVKSYTNNRTVLLRTNENASQESFDRWHLKTCSGIIETSNSVMKLGTSQKMINIFLKYHFVYLYARLDEEWNQNNQWIRRWGKYFHVPIDVQVIKNLAENNTYRELNNIALPIIIINENDARIINDGYAIEWTKLTFEKLSQYNLIQTRIKELLQLQHVVAEFDTPLDFEMEYLWV